MITTSPFDERIYREARIALVHVIDGARYQLEAVHRRPNGELDDTYEKAHDDLITYGGMSRVIA